MCSPMYRVGLQKKKKNLRNFINFSALLGAKTGNFFSTTEMDFFKDIIKNSRSILFLSCFARHKNQNLTLIIFIAPRFSLLLISGSKMYDFNYSQWRPVDEASASVS